MFKLLKCRECKQNLPRESFSLSYGKPRKLCKQCASAAQSARYHGQGVAGRERAARNSEKYFQAHPTKVRFNIAKSAAKQCGHEWTLTFAQFEQLNSQSCYYCGGPLPPKGRGLDRVDNSKGYTLDNVLPCCKTCNEIRADNLTVSETKIVVTVLKALRKPGLWESREEIPEAEKWWNDPEFNKEPGTPTLIT